MRLITRSDFDGLACAVLLRHAGIIDSFNFAHPKDIQDGKVEVTENDVLANVPYVAGCGLWFDHHISEAQRGSLDKEFKGACYNAPSAAHIVYDYYGGQEKFPQFDALLAAVDKADAGQFTLDEIQNPTNWALLSFIMDPRTGLGRYRDYRISNYQLMEALVEYCQQHAIDEILTQPDVQERVQRYFEQEAEFEIMLHQHTRVQGSVIITDLRGVAPIATGNRFKIYSLFPEQSVSLWVTDGRNKENVSIAVGRSIINRTCQTNIGWLMLKYGGGGHAAAGTCQVLPAEADRVVAEIITALEQPDPWIR